MADDPNVYILGRGTTFFDRYVAGTKVGSGERYIGNTPSFNMATQTQMLEHYSSDHGLKVKDASVQLQNDRAGKFQTDNIHMKNLALLFGTDATTRTTNAAAGQSELFTVQKGLYYQLGATSDRVDGVKKIDTVTVSDNTGVHATGTLTFGGQPTAADTVTISGVVLTFVAGTPSTNQIQIGGSATITAQALKTYINEHPSVFHVTAAGASTVITVTAIVGGTAANSYTLAKSGTYPSVSAANLAGGTAAGNIPADGNWEVDLDLGRLRILPDAASISNDDIITVAYGILDDSQTVVVDDGAEMEGTLRFISDNPEGDNIDYFWPRVKITVSGDYALKGDTWLVIDFNFDVLIKDSSTKRVYVTKR